MWFALDVIWQVFAASWYLFLIVGVLLVFKALSPTLRKYWRGGL